MKRAIYFFLIIVFFTISSKSFGQYWLHTDLNIIQVSPPPQVLEAHQNWLTNTSFGQFVDQNYTFLGTYWKIASPSWDEKYYAVYLTYGYLSLVTISPNGKAVDFMFMSLGSQYLNQVQNQKE